MTLVCLLYPTLKTFYSLFQIVFLLLVYLRAKRISSPDTPATATCKEKLLIALHNSLLLVLLDIWEQNILVFDEDWVGRLLDFPTIGVVERKVWCSRCWNFIVSSISTFILRFVQAMVCEFMILEYVSLRGKWSSFYKWLYLLTYSMEQSPSWEANQ
jgi:hypothetical protein